MSQRLNALALEPDLRLNRRRAAPRQQPPREEDDDAQKDDERRNDRPLGCAERELGALLLSPSIHRVFERDPVPAYLRRLGRRDVRVEHVPCASRRLDSL